MNEKKFKVGDRVAVTVDWVRPKKDAVGTAIKVDSYDSTVLVEFDEHMDGHSGDGDGKAGHCWWLDFTSVKLINPDWKIIIIPEGNKTNARLYENGKVVKSVITRKHPDDEYSVKEACKSCMNMLFGEEKEEPSYNGFKIGDIVEYTGGNLPTGVRGEVVCFDTIYKVIGVDFKIEYPGLNTLEAHLPEKTGYWCVPWNIEKV